MCSCALIDGPRQQVQGLEELYVVLSVKKYNIVICMCRRKTRKATDALLFRFVSLLDAIQLLIRFRFISSHPVISEVKQAIIQHPDK